MEITEDMPKSMRKKLCLEEIRTLADLNVPYSINKYALSKKYMVDWHSVDNWTRKILLNRPLEDIQLIGRKAEITINNMLSANERIALNKDNDIKDRMSAMQNIVHLLETQARILEAYDRKPMATQKVDFSVKSINWVKETREYKLILDKLNPSERDKIADAVANKYSLQNATD